MGIFLVCRFKNNIAVYKLPISFIDVVSHVSSTVISMTKCVVSDFHGRQWNVSSVL